MTYLIRQIGHMAFSSPDPEGAARDLAEISGLAITGRDDDAVYLTSNSRHHEVSYRKGAGKAIAIGLEAINAAAVDEVYRRAKSDGLAILGDKPLGPFYERAVTIVAPGGAVFEVHTPIARNQPIRPHGTAGHPRRIEHANAFSPDTAAFGEFCEKVLALRLSDRTADDGLRWYRAEDGFHHAIAMGTGAPMLHHYAFDHHAVDDLVRVADTLHAKGRSLAWGPGRHGAGGNIFTYYADPHGCLVENSVEMERIDRDDLHEPRAWDMSQGIGGKWINLWGTPPTSAFLVPGIAFES